MPIARKGSLVCCAALAAAMLAGCATTDRAAAGRGPEAFDDFFARARADADFLARRTAPTFAATQFAWQGERAGIEPERVRCTPAEVERFELARLPDGPRLAQSGAAYAAPEPVSEREVRVSLGPPEGEADARYLFRSVRGEWYLQHVEIYTVAPPGEADGLPCAAAGRAG
jgi:hypothetical protein